MNTYIVTIKLPRRKDHDPRNKKTGRCWFSDECTDVTGEHHSGLVKAENKEAAQKRFKEFHVTRIERVL